MQQVGFTLSLLCLVGCVRGAGETGAAASAQQLVDLARPSRALVAEYVVPFCGAPMPRGALCGLVTDEMTGNEYLQELTSKCEALSLSTDECASRFLQEFEARLGVRYPRAVEAEVLATCARAEAACGELLGRELAWLRSHDEHVVVAARASGDMLSDNWTAHHATILDRYAGTPSHGRVWSAVLATLRGDELASAEPSASEPSSPPAPSADAPFHASATLGCTSDLDCPIGLECTTGVGARGVCLTPIHDRGLNGSSAGVTVTMPTAAASSEGDCTVDGDCGSGMRCRKRLHAGIGRCGR